MKNKLLKLLLICDVCLKCEGEPRLRRLNPGFGVPAAQTPLNPPTPSESSANTLSLPTAPETAPASLPESPLFSSPAPDLNFSTNNMPSFSEPAPTPSFLLPAPENNTTQGMLPPPLPMTTNPTSAPVINYSLSEPANNKSLDMAKELDILSSPIADDLDVEERVQVILKLQQLNHELEEMVSQATAICANMTKLYEPKDKEKNNFLEKLFDDKNNLNTFYVQTKNYLADKQKDNNDGIITTNLSFVEEQLRQFDKKIDQIVEIEESINNLYKEISSITDTQANQETLNIKRIENESNTTLNDAHNLTKPIDEQKLTEKNNDFKASANQSLNKLKELETKVTNLCEQLTSKHDQLTTLIKETQADQVAMETKIQAIGEEKQKNARKHEDDLLKKTQEKQSHFQQKPNLSISSETNMVDHHSEPNHLPLIEVNPEDQSASALPHNFWIVTQEVIVNLASTLWQGIEVVVSRFLKGVRAAFENPSNPETKKSEDSQASTTPPVNFAPAPQPVPAAPLALPSAPSIPAMPTMLPPAPSLPAAPAVSESHANPAPSLPPSPPLF